MNIKLYGERHTNTNYLSRLIQQNLDCGFIEGVVPKHVRTLERLGLANARDRYFAQNFTKTLGWKHTAVPPWEALQNHVKTQQTRFVTLTKNPYAWIVSMHRRPYHQPGAANLDIDEFLQYHWAPLARENIGADEVTITQLWNLKNGSYLNLPNKLTERLTSEEVQFKAAAVISKIATLIGQKGPSKLNDVSESTKKRPDQDGDYYRTYYGEARWKDTLSPSAINRINAEVDQNLMERFNFEIL